MPVENKLKAMETTTELFFFSTHGSLSGFFSFFHLCCRVPRQILCMCGAEISLLEGLKLPSPLQW